MRKAKWGWYKPGQIAKLILKRLIWASKKGFREPNTDQLYSYVKNNRRRPGKESNTDYPIHADPSSFYRTLRSLEADGFITWDRKHGGPLSSGGLVSLTYSGKKTFDHL